MKLFRIFFAVLLVISVAIPLRSADAVSTVSGIITVGATSSKPSILTIPSIKVSSVVKAMGLTADNKMAVPDNFTEVGLFAAANSTKLGEIGNAVMGAHVDNGSFSPTVSGVFKNLHKLVPGDDIFVTNKNGDKLHFKVVATKIYPYNTTSTSEVFGPSNEAHLNLITCYGKWLSKAGTYSQRLVVFTTLV